MSGCISQERLHYGQMGSCFVFSDKCQGRRVRCSILGMLRLLLDAHDYGYQWRLVHRGYHRWNDHFRSCHHGRGQWSLE